MFALIDRVFVIPEFNNERYTEEMEKLREMTKRNLNNPQYLNLNAEERTNVLNQDLNYFKMRAERLLEEDQLDGLDTNRTPFMSNLQRAIHSIKNQTYITNTNPFKNQPLKNISKSI